MPFVLLCNTINKTTYIYLSALFKPELYANILDLILILLRNPNRSTKLIYFFVFRVTITNHQPFTQMACFQQHKFIGHIHCKF